jgi:hypothetical protein
LGLRKDARFGGADTAIRLFLRLGESFPLLRIVVLSERAGDFEPAQWEGWEHEQSGAARVRTVAFLADNQQPLEISESDYFIATHWLTAYYLRLIKADAARRGSRINKSIYLIQDFEPGFYAWSGRYLLAESTYHSNQSTIAIFNTTLLANYFERNGYEFPRHFAFEPKLSPALRSLRGQIERPQKERILLVYGRPSVARNAFDLAVAALKEWASTYAGAPDWTIVSLGERHEPIQLAPGMVMRSEGKVSFEQYGSYLARASVGLSLMVSPHPSYPPLEMAEFGLRVVTNDFDNKGLSSHSPLIKGVSAADPKTLALALSECCDAYQPQAPAHYADTDFSAPGEEFPFMAELTSYLLAP